MQQRRKSEEMLQSRKLERFQEWEGFPMLLLALWCKDMGKDRRETPLEWRAAPSWQPTRKECPQFYNHKKPSSANTWWAWKRILPRASSWEPGQLTCWFQPFETWSWETRKSNLYFWPRELWNNTFLSFSGATVVVIWYSRNRKLIHNAKNQAFVCLLLGSRGENPGVSQLGF